jgi:stage II sporulation protein M
MLHGHRFYPWTDWWDAHRPYAVVVLGTFLLGGLLGALALDALTGTTRLQLLELVTRFLNVTTERAPNLGPLLGTALVQNLRVLGLIYLLGVSVAGLPLVLLAVLFRGFVLGFAVGFFLGALHSIGLLVSLIAIVLPNLAILPAWLATGAGGVRFSWQLLARGGDGGRWSLVGELAQFTVVAVVAVGLVGVGSALQAVVAPTLLHWLGPWGV